MQVNLSATLPNSMPDAAANPVARQDAGPGSSFSAHLKNILNSRGAPDASAESKTAEQSTAAAGKDVMTSLPKISPRLGAPQEQAKETAGLDEQSEAVVSQMPSLVDMDRSLQPTANAGNAMADAAKETTGLDEQGDAIERRMPSLVDMDESLQPDANAGNAKADAATEMAADAVGEIFDALKNLVGMTGNREIAANTLDLKQKASDDSDQPDSSQAPNASSALSALALIPELVAMMSRETETANPESSGGNLADGVRGLPASQDICDAETVQSKSVPKQAESSAETLEFAEKAPVVPAESRMGAENMLPRVGIQSFAQTDWASGSVSTNALLRDGMAASKQTDSASGRPMGVDLRPPGSGTELSQSFSLFKSAVSESWTGSEIQLQDSGSELAKSGEELDLLNAVLADSARGVIALRDSSASNVLRVSDNIPSSESLINQADVLEAAPQSRSEIVVQTGSENKGTGDSHADQGHSGNNSGFGALLNRQGGFSIDFSKPRTAVLENQPDISAQLVSGSIRMADAGAPKVTANAEIAPSQPRDFILQLADRIQIQVQDGKGEIRVQLQPDNLGHLEIRAENTVNGVVAHIVAESGSVKNYLESNLQTLQQSLQDQGLKVTQIQVSVQDGSGFESFSGYAAQSGYSGSGNQGRGANHIAGGSGLLDVDQEDPMVDLSTSRSLNPNSRFYTVA
jgi:hypothetical protein